MSLLEAHLEQIKYSCQGIDSLPFPPPKIFTNALLSSHDITSLIRDTEAHERALFSVPAPPAPPAKSSSSHREKDKDVENPPPSRRRQTIFNVAEGEVTTGPPKRQSAAATGGASARRHHNTAVAAVLGGEVHDQLRRGGAIDRKGDMDVDILLRGAEKLCTVYELPGARERIAALRNRSRHARGTMDYYEARVAEQAEQLAAMNVDWMEQEEEQQEEEDGAVIHGGEGEAWTEEDLRREEEEARLMEVRKRELQARLRSMEKDLGALRNM